MNRPVTNVDNASSPNYNAHAVKSIMGIIEKEQQSESHYDPTRGLSRIAWKRTSSVSTPQLVHAKASAPSATNHVDRRRPRCSSWRGLEHTARRQTPRHLASSGFCHGRIMCVHLRYLRRERRRGHVRLLGQRRDGARRREHTRWSWRSQALLLGTVG
jgi:hypothetical protein